MRRSFTALMAGFTFVAVSAAAITSASAVIVTVQSTAQPWSPTANPTTPAYINSGATASEAINVIAGNSITIQYLDGLTTAFGGSPIVDADGYVGGLFGSGSGTPGRTGIGTLGPLPSFFIDPTNSGPDINLNELLGVFVDGSGAQVATPFAIGTASLTTTVPTGALYLFLGLNDDIFEDNFGSLRVEVTGDGVGIAETPIPGALPLFVSGLGMLGFVAHRRRRKQAA